MAISQNSWASARKDVLLIVCDSAASWMMNNLINNHGGLHNRVTHHLPIEPFTLSECEQFFKNRSATFNRYQLLQLYMVLGGIPFYLDMIDITQSAAQNINRLCFTPKGSLRREFDNLYPFFLGFITTYGLAHNEHPMSLVQHAITMDALFEQAG